MPPPDRVTGDDGPLLALIGNQLAAFDHHDDPDVARLVEEIRRRHHGRVAAVLMYGSYLRGKRDTLLDFYVLLDDLRSLPRRWHAAANRLLPPNVYHVALPPTSASAAIRAKYATMTLAQFEQAMGRFQSYFWSRFTQPCGLVYAAAPEVRRRVTAALGEAVHAFVRRVAPLLPQVFQADSLWRHGFALTYTCELRSESRTGVASVYEHHARHFDALLQAYAGSFDGAAAVIVTEDGSYRCRPPANEARVRLGWRLRRVQGKALSVLRLIKAAGTFDDPLDYLLWKIQRHSGIYIPPTERQRHHPLIFAWPLLWRLYRRGAFR